MSDNSFFDVGSVFPVEVSIISIPPHTPANDALKLMLANYSPNPHSHV